MSKGRTKLKLTVSSFILHAILAFGFTVAWIITKTTEPLVWAGWFASFNTTLGIYEATKTYKDKVLIENKEN